jgi:hypothetical protein
LKRISLETAVRLLLVIFCIILFLLIYRLADEKDAVNDPVIEDSEVVYVEEPITTVSSEATIETSQVEEPILLETPILFTEVVYSKPITCTAAIDQCKLLDSLINTITLECDSNNYQKPAVLTMRAEIERLVDIKTQLETDIGRFTDWEAEYPYATKVWYFLRSAGYSEEVSAGIIGNMMVETSGGTLALKPTICDSTGMYYGLCQWSVIYHPKVINKPFDEQLNYLLDTIEQEFKVFGKCYWNGFTYDDFLKLKTPEEAAHAFAAVYERCSTSSYFARTQAARVAYNYFTSEVN